jgi:hypothetical protein
MPLRFGPQYVIIPASDITVVVVSACFCSSSFFSCSLVGTEADSKNNSRMAQWLGFISTDSAHSGSVLADD